MSTPRPDGPSEQVSASPVSHRVTGGRLRTFAGLFVILALAFGLRARAVEHGMPSNYVPDTHVVRSALGMAQDRDPVPPVGKYSTYPNLVPYALLPLYASHYALGLASERWANSESYGHHLSEHPEDVHRIARWLMLVFGALTPLVVFFGARAMGLHEGAWAAAFLVATGLMHLHFSVQERPWVAMVFFAALSAWPAALHARTGRTRYLLLSGAAAALAAACHQSGLVVLGIAGLAWLVSPIGWGVDLLHRAKRGALCVALFVAIALLLGYPSYLRYGLPTAEQTIGAGEADLAVGGQSINFGRRWETFPRLALALFGYEPLLLLLGLVGLVGFLKRRAALPVGIFTLAWAAFFMTHSNDHVRYLLPVAVLLAFPAGACFERIWTRGPLARGVLCLLALIPLVQSVRLGTLLGRDDTRVEGAQLLAEVPEGAFVAIDRYGPEARLDQASLELLTALREKVGSELYRREARRFQALREGARDDGMHAINVSDLFGMDERTGEVRILYGLEDALGRTPEEALRTLGVTHVLLVNRLRSGTDGNLLAALVDGLEPLRTIRPAESDSSDVEARLPMELEFPLSAIWRLEHPGPWMGLYELD
jgi:hypothetical protein